MHADLFAMKGPNTLPLKTAQRLERDFRNKRAALIASRNAKKPDGRPPENSGSMRLPVMATVGAAMVEATTAVATQEGQRSQANGTIAIDVWFHISRRAKWQRFDATNQINAQMSDGGFNRIIRWTRHHV